MKKIAFLLFAVLTVYFASMYRLASLTTLFIAQILVFVAMFLLSHYLLHTTNIMLQSPVKIAQKERDALCRLSVRHAGRIPVGLIRLRLRYRYLRETKPRTQIISLDAAHMQELPIRGFYCGLLHLETDRLWACDYLQLFSPGKQITNVLTLPIFPNGRALRFVRTAGSRETFVPIERMQYAPDNSSQEIRQIREYRPGDTRRSIHWNQSARTDTLWVKEYEKQEELCAVLLLDNNTAGTALGNDDWSAFYELASAVILGLLQCVKAIQVYWYDPAYAAFRQQTVCDIEQCRMVLYSLYKAESAAEEHKSVSSAGISQDYFCLTTRLMLYYGVSLLARFSAEKLEQQITERTIIL
nr:DUF58 domain-containing protein [uncultured Agathobaculum sp.]